MRTLRFGLPVAALAVCAAHAMAGPPQVTTRKTARDSVRADTLRDSLDFGFLRRPSVSNLTIATGKTYNRVEGLPLHFGPFIKGGGGRSRYSVSTLGIMRTAHGLHWDAHNVGHITHGEAKFGDDRGFSISGSTYDIVTPVETWQLGDGESGIATALFHRDYRDYFGRHGGAISLSGYTSSKTSLNLSYAHERWSTLGARDVFTFWRNGEAWRPNPTTDDGRVHLWNLQWKIDTRNEERNPSYGWLFVADYERGVGDMTSLGDRSALAAEDARSHVDYGRMTIDLRRYNRLSPSSQLNGRVFWGGRVNGGPLPLERRFSMSGVGAMPGFDFRAPAVGADVGQCSTGTPPPGNPAQCERVLLMQLEFRGDLAPDLISNMRQFPFRIRSREIPLNPVWVAFVDAGRGWLLGERQGVLRYSKGLGVVPDLGSFWTDVGIGLDLGPLGVYAAKAVSIESMPANIFVRVKHRF